MYRYCNWYIYKTKTDFESSELRNSKVIHNPTYKHSDIINQAETLYIFCQTLFLLSPLSFRKECLFNFLILNSSIFVISATPGGAVVGSVYPDAGGLDEIYQVRTKRKKDKERKRHNITISQYTSVSSKLWRLALTTSTRPPSMDRGSKYW